MYPAFREDPLPFSPLHPSVRERFDETTRLGAFELPLLPDSASRVIAATRRDDVHARTLADLIRRDAALTGHVLRVAGSALYLGSPLVSFQQAISRLGMAAIREIALLVAFQTRVFRVEGHESMVKGMFRHALAAAVYAEEIARVRRWNLEEAFLIGLLHDVGRPVLLQLLVDIARANEVILDSEAALEAIVPRHAEVGAAIALRFGLPEAVADAVRNHHQPTGGPPQGAPLAALADRLAHVVLEDADPDPLKEDPLLGLVNLYPEDLAALLERKDHVLAAVHSLS